MDEGCQLEKSRYCWKFGVEGVEVFMIQMYINDQKRDLEEGDISSEFGGIVTIEAFKELGQELGP